MLVAISGGTGFIGKRLVSIHLGAGDTVRVLTHRPLNHSLNLQKTVDFYQGDLTQGFKALIPFVEGVDILYHCAAEINDPSRMHLVNVIGTKNLLDAASHRIKHWVQLSSVGVYGPHSKGSITEKTSLNPLGIYENTKSKSDQLVVEAGNNNKISYSILRPSTVYGPDMPNRSLFQLIATIDQGVFFFIGKPGAVANYIHVDNVVEALRCCGIMSEAKGQIYNLSDQCSFEELVEIICQALGRKNDFPRIPETIVRAVARCISWLPGVPLTTSRINALTTRCVYSNNKIEQQLKYIHRVSIREGLSNLALERKKTYE